jgi:hypothetical protein
MVVMNSIWGSKEFLLQVQKVGYNIAFNTLFSHVKCGNITHTAKIDGSRFVFTEKDLLQATEWLKQHSRKLKKHKAKK